MSVNERAAGAAAILVEARRSGVPVDELPEALAPRTLDEAYAIQDAVSRGLGPIGGWKVGMNPATREIGCAPIPADLVVPADLVTPGGGELQAARFRGLALEIEFAFRLSRNLPPRDGGYDREAVAQAVEGFCPAIEVVATRYSDPKAVNTFSQIADSSSNGLLVWGQPVGSWRSIDFRALRGELTIDGTVVQSAMGTHPCDDPFDLVVWLANHAATRTGGLTAGTVVITGSLQGATPIAAGSAAVARIGDYPPLQLRFV
ncbi:MAG TPA: fumarylacetoacetate hydrolase family protein [Stellaceae bacterium]|nr:fumarylacetoacetate hydrolase family protein [Stellaceae bacterium]